MKENNKIFNYDIISIVQIIMSFIVVGIHVRPIITTNEIFMRLWETIASIAVPFFFLTSSFFFFQKYLQFSGKENNNLIKDKIKKYYNLYLIWNIIYIPITIYGIFISDFGKKKQFFC